MTKYRKLKIITETRPDYTIIDEYSSIDELSIIDMVDRNIYIAKSMIFCSPMEAEYYSEFFYKLGCKAQDGITKNKDFDNCIKEILYRYYLDLSEAFEALID